MISKIAGMFRRKYFPTEQELNVKKWYADDGEFTSRLNYELDKNAIVFDLGGYKGQWASDIYSKYLCKIFVFEPASIFYFYITERFKNNPFIRTFNFGLGAKDDEEIIYLSAESTSAYRNAGDPESISIKRFDNFVKDLNIGHIDLLKINIEGGEYDLLDHIIDTGVISNIKNIQVQFHTFFPEAETRMQGIQKRLALTHSLTYQYRYVWENWTIR